MAMWTGATIEVAVVSVDTVTPRQGSGANCAVTDLVALSSVTTQLVPSALGVQPDQLPKMWLESGASVSVTDGMLKVTVQLELQFSVPSVDVMVPPPAFVSAICEVPVPASVAEGLP